MNEDALSKDKSMTLYHGTNGTIKREDIDKLSIKKIESVIFDLTDNLGKKDIKGALQVLKNYI